ncbi:hypothetical protein GCM10023170_032010 [Phytohabitans houttuyneae]|uniref:CU044_5270 family protein n=1 Tax=Phytohabitans houttuyneae TaxID=1076126 RepID=A0A6V8K842_9ACTN|nr:hypothetical protein Phou_023460 [Phytohabitans houttuyneae]
MRDLPPGLPEPTDESVSRTWHRITAQRKPARARTPSRILVPAMAAALVAGLVVGGAALFRPDGGGGDLEAGSPSDEKTAEPNLTPASPQTVAVLHALAEAAKHGPAAAKVRPGQLIFVYHDGWAASFQANAGGAKGEGAAGAAPPEANLESGTIERQIREMWFDPQGMVPRSITDGSKELGTGGDRGQVEPTDLGLRAPTPEWIAGLPTDPEQLRGKLRELAGEGGAWSTDHSLWNALQDFYFTSDLLMTPELRAALLLSFTGLRGITSSETTIDGRRLVAVRHTERGVGDEILFDPATGSAVGRRSVTLDADLKIVSGPGVPKLDPDVTYQATWTQKVVATVGDR